jgi:hypothetical protein
MRSSVSGWRRWRRRSCPGFAPRSVRVMTVSTWAQREELRFGSLPRAGYWWCGATSRRPVTAVIGMVRRRRPAVAGTPTLSMPIRSSRGTATCSLGRRWSRASRWWLGRSSDMSDHRATVRGRTFISRCTFTEIAVLPGRSTRFGSWLTGPRLGDPRLGDMPACRARQSIGRLVRCRGGVWAAARVVRLSAA